MRGPIGFALLFSIACAANASEVADYRFDSNLQSSIAGAPALVELEPFGGAFAADPLLGRTVWVYPEKNGFVLDVSALLPANQYSIAMQMRSTLEQVYVKLVDNSDRQSDHGFYLSYDDLGFYPRSFGNDNEYIDPDTWYLLVMTRRADGEIAGYVDGVERFRFQDEENEALMPASGQLYFLRDDRVTADGENSRGSIARLRLFNTALTPQEVLALGGGPRIFRNGFES